MTAQKEPRDLSIGELIVRLVGDGKAYIASEIAYYRALASERISDAGVAAGLAVAAVLIAQAALFALLVGLILILEPMIGIALATTVVVLVAVALVAILGWCALSRLKRATRPITEETP